MNDAQDQDDPIFLDHVIHDTVIADTKAMERVA